MTDVRSRRALREARNATRKSRFTAISLALGLCAATGIVASTPAFAAVTADAGGSAAPVIAAAALGANVPLVDILDDADAALADAHAALAAADALNAEVSAAGLDLGDAPTRVSTADLKADITKLDDLEVIPVLLLPQFTEDVTAHVATATSETAALRTVLQTAKDKAEAERIAAEAAAKAAAEQAAAEAAAAEQARLEAEAAAAVAAASTPDGARSAAQAMLGDYGWSADQFGCLDSLWSKESGWNVHAENPGSGAYGIPQSLPGDKMATMGDDWADNAVTQIRWGLQYIADVYGTPCSAWGHSQATDWY